MSNWNNFRRENKNKGYSISELSEMYYNQNGGGLKDIKNKAVNLAKSIATHSDDLLNLAKHANKIYNDLHTTDEKGKKVLKPLTKEDLNSHLNEIKKLATNTNTVVNNIKKTHSEHNT